MPRTMYCWRCRTELPMLSDEEWELVWPHLRPSLIMQHRAEKRVGLQEALMAADALGFGKNRLEIYEEITGFKELNSNVLFHHRISLYGPDCHLCGKPLRTPKAKFCAACGAERIES